LLTPLLCTLGRDLGTSKCELQPWTTGYGHENGQLLASNGQILVSMNRS
jgi:hypothetical protein